MPDFPLGRYELFRSDKLDFTRDTVGRIFTPHRLDLIGPHATLDAWMRTRRLRDLTVNCISYGAEVRIGPGEIDTFFLVQVPMAGAADVRCGGQRLLSTPRSASVISPGEHFAMRWSADCTKLVCRIEQSALEAQLSDILGGPVPEPLRFDTAMDLTAGIGLSWKIGMNALVGELDRPDGTVHHPLVAHHAERALMTTLLLGQPHNHTARINGDRASAHSRAVRMALELIESHPEHEHTTAGLARAAGVSMRALQRGFQRDLNTSPMAHLRTVRLRRVRDALRAAAPGGVTVTDIAARWGFTHPGHFAREYRRLFGEKPSQTLRR
jgi:AraC-like DNA-binding protein